MKKVYILLLIMFDGTAFAVAENHEGDTTVVEKQAELQEVKVMGYRRIAQDDAKKTVYQLSRTLPKNTTTDVALMELPELQKGSAGFSINGNDRPCRLLIDGIDANMKELESLKASDVSRVEIKNISADGNQYGGEINIIRKRRDRMLNGSVSYSNGTLREFESLYPTISYRDGKLEIYTVGTLLHNNQEGSMRLERVTADNTRRIYTMYSDNSIWQYYGMVKAGYEFSPKLSTYASYTYSGFGTKTQKRFEDIIDNNQNGDETEMTKGKNESKDDVGSYLVNVVVKMTHDKNNRLFLKGRFHSYKNGYQMENIDDSRYESKMNEYSIEALQEMDSLRLFGGWHDMNIGLRGVFRDNKSMGRKATGNNVYMAYVNDNIKLSKRLSLYWQLKADCEEYLLTGHTKRELAMLPSVILNYSMPKSSLKLSAERFVFRPSIDYLNTNRYYSSEVSQTYGNADLNSQYMQRVQLSYGQQVKGAQLNFGIGYRYATDIIMDIYGADLNSTTYMNAGYSNLTTLTASYMQPLFKNRLILNASAALKYYDDRIDSKLKGSVQSTDVNGWGFDASAYVRYVSTKGWMYLVNGSLSTNIYDINARKTSVPILTLSVSKSLLKDCLTLSARVQGVPKMKQTTHYHFRTEWQRTEFETNMSNIILTAKWNFGKRFTKRDMGTSISVNDITTKE
ncbi:MAG: outer membrane beta-barrel protein [Prevotella sp.]|nr:outer membrane beta-barrel protein [Prevotella sp.]